MTRDDNTIIPPRLPASRTPRSTWRPLVGVLPARRRVLYLAAKALTIAAGLSSSAWPVGWYLWDKSLGDGLYAVAVYLILPLIFPTLRVIMAAGAALGFCLAIEAFKFTGLPADRRGWRISRLTLGTTPSWHNVACYVVAIAVATGREASTGHGRSPTP